MLQRLKQLASKARRLPVARLAGRKGVRIHGHRSYVGGLWDEIGTLQFEFLKGQGLRPEHVFVDVACGSLRAGVHLIGYLERGNYLGIDIEKELIDRGIKYELGEDVALEKAPEFVVSGSFEFDKFNKKADYGIAQSLFTHITKDDIESCMKNLSSFMNEGGKFFVTFNESHEPVKNPQKSHPHSHFQYTVEEMILFGRKCGWHPTYIGDWEHPRNQRMMLYAR